MRLPRTALRRSPAARAVRLIAKPTVVALWHTVLGRPTSVRMIMERVLRRLGRLDRSAYQSVAAMSTPLLDRPLRRVSDFADFSKPWLLVAAALALFGGTRGRRAAVTGIVAIGLSSLLVNQLIKLIGERSRPDRTQLGVPESRWVLMPARCSDVQPQQSPDGGLARAPAAQTAPTTGLARAVLA